MLSPASARLAGGAVTGSRSLSFGNDLHRKLALALSNSTSVDSDFDSLRHIHPSGDACSMHSTVCWSGNERSFGKSVAV